MKKRSCRSLFVGIILLAGLVFVVSHYGELTRFIVLLRGIDPLWLLTALFFQAGTYISLAMVWYRGLADNGIRYPLIRLIPLAVAKLFADQALPSGGISGIAFVVNAFRQRNVSGSTGMRVMLLGILSYYGAYLLVAALALLALQAHHDIRQWMIVVATLFTVVAVFIPGIILLVRQAGAHERIPGWLLRIPRVEGLLHVWSPDADDGPHRHEIGVRLLAEATFFQTAIFFLDAATLWAMLQALGEPIRATLAFPAFVIASIVAMLSPVPMGLGTFDATCVALLVMFDVRIETALTATLLLRGFTLWLPMIPGLLLTRMEMR